MEVDVKDSTINSFIIEGFTKNIPLIDIFTLLTKQVDDIKKITIFHDPINIISNSCKCQVDFTNHESLVKAKLILKAQNLNNLFNISGQKIKISECLLNQSNLINETSSQTTALMFENVQINKTNILEFISHLKQYINSNNENKNNKNNYKISKVRQYSNRILVFFEPVVPHCIKKFLRKGENETQSQIPYYNYNGKNIPVIPKMKPVVNIGKYRERNVKLSAYSLNEEDRENLYKIFDKKENNMEDNLMLSKMAENAFNNILNRDKVIREEKLKKNNITNNSLNKKREREREKIRDKNIDKEKERLERDRERDSRNRDRLRDNRIRDMKSKARERDRRDKNRDYNNYNSRNIMDERREESSSDRDRKGDNTNINMNNMNNNNYRNQGSNIMNNSNNIINNNLNGLNINEKDLNQVASLFSNANAMNLVKYLLENNTFNNLNSKTNNSHQNLNNNTNNNIGNLNNINNNNNLIQNKLPVKLKEEHNSPNNLNNILKNNNNNNYNEVFKNLYSPNQNNTNNNNNVNFQQLLNVFQSQNQSGMMNSNNNKTNQSQQRMNNNTLNNNMGNNFQNLLNLNQMMGIDNNNLLNNNYFNNQRSFQFPLNEQLMNQFTSFNSPQKRKINEN